MSVAGFLTAVLLAVSAVPAPAPGIERVSVSRSGAESNDWTSEVALSGDGRTVVFISYATNLVPGDPTINNPDIFVRDLNSRKLRRIAIPGPVPHGYFGVEQLAVDHTGRHVVFRSSSSRLVKGDTNGVPDVFVHDLKTGTTRRVSVTGAGQQADGESNVRAGAVSADGRYVAFTSDAANLVPGDTNRGEDVFVRDLRAGTTTRVSVTSTGKQGDNTEFGNRAAVISGDGRYVGFVSHATNLVPRDTNGYEDVFVHDRRTRTTGRVSVSSTGTQGSEPSSDVGISTDGHFIIFPSRAPDLVPGDTNDSYDVFVRDLRAHTTERVSLTPAGNQLDRESHGATISANGRYAAFWNGGDAVADGNPDVADTYLRDRERGTTTRLSRTASGEVGNHNSFGISMSRDTRTIAFLSDSTNLVPGDTNNVEDAFVRVMDPRRAVSSR